MTQDFDLDRYVRNSRAVDRRALGRGVYTGHLVSMLGSALTREFIAIQMTWGAMNELSAINSYRAMIEKTENPVLRDILRRIIKDERRQALAHAGVHREHAA